MSVQTILVMLAALLVGVLCFAFASRIASQVRTEAGNWYPQTPRLQRMEFAERLLTVLSIGLVFFAGGLVVAELFPAVQQSGVDVFEGLF